MTEKKVTSEKVLKRLGKRNAQTGSSSKKGETGNIKNLQNQYNVIRKDILKLREDLQKGYDMARGMVDRKSLIKDFLKAK